jgi:SNF2 family DNA or RNA helicase
MEFKKFLPGFRILSYHGSMKRRKELRQGWNDKFNFNVCITSYTLASKDSHIFKRKAWYYMILDEAHMIKNFKSQRWNILLMFRSYRRLLLTGTPLQNNLTELWALLQFLMSGANFANLKEFGEWFSSEQRQINHCAGCPILIFYHQTLWNAQLRWEMCTTTKLYSASPSYTRSCGHTFSVASNEM